MELSWTWPGLVVIALIVAACFQGYQKGLIKELVSAFFMIFSILIVWGINPYVNTFIRDESKNSSSISVSASSGGSLGCIIIKWLSAG